MRTALFQAGVALAVCWASVAAAESTLQDMTDKINRAAEDMGEPHDAVSPALRDAFPGVDVSAHASCVSYHATPEELSQMGGTQATGGSVVGEGGTPSEIAASIAARPETRECFDGSGLAGLPQ